MIQRRLLLLLLPLLMLTGQLSAQTYKIQKVKRIYQGTVQRGRTTRNMDVYPNTSAGKNAFFAQVNAGCISITLTNGSVIQGNCGGDPNNPSNPTNPNPGPGTVAPAGYGGIYAANSSYTPFATERPAGTTTGQEPYARSYLAFGSVQVGVNLSAGGVTDVLRFDGGKNLINTFRHGNGKLDAGRSWVGSWYGYPNGGEEGHYQEAGQSTEQIDGPGHPSIGWNPVEPGDEGGNPNYSTVHSFGNNGSAIYKKVQGMQWDLRNVPGQAYTETWLKPDPNNNRAVRNHMRLTMFRSDSYASHFPTPRQQEGPCLYHVSDYREYYYCAAQAYVYAPLTRYYTPGRGAPEPPVFASEPAIYARNPANGRVLVMYAPHSGRYIAGDFLQDGGQTGTIDTDNAAMYMAAAPLICLDRDGVYDFDTALAEFENMDQARAWVYAQPRWDGLFETRFDNNIKSRSGWMLHHAGDQLEKNITNGWQVRPLFDNDNQGKDMAINAPERWVNGRVVKHIYFRASFVTGTNQFVIRFKKAGDNSDYYHEFTVNTSGAEQVYDIDLSSDPNWNNQDIVQWNIVHHYNNRVPVDNDVWTFKWISYRNLN